MNPQTYRAKINAALKPLGLKIVAGRGYSYFHDAAGNQIGESVFVCRQSDQSIESWFRDAQNALAQHNKYLAKA